MQCGIWKFLSTFVFYKLFFESMSIENCSHAVFLCLACLVQSHLNFYHSLMQFMVIPVGSLIEGEGEGETLRSSGSRKFVLSLLRVLRSSKKENNGRSDYISVKFDWISRRYGDEISPSVRIPGLLCDECVVLAL